MDNDVYFCINSAFIHINNGIQNIYTTIHCILCRYWKTRARPEVVL